jgi:hypothetical protein
MVGSGFICPLVESKTMNKRVIELRQKAHAFALANCADENGSVDERKRADIFQQKYVESIVRECAKFIEDRSGYDDCGNAWHPEPEELLAYFGIENERI